MCVMFDVNLEALVDETHTLSNFLSPRIDEADSLRKTIQKPAWPNIDICPANLGLQETEWELTATIAEGPTAIDGALRMLKIGRAACRERVCQYEEIPGVDVSLTQRRDESRKQRVVKG